jgi:hypothetical protein
MPLVSKKMLPERGRLFAWKARYFIEFYSHPLVPAAPANNRTRVDFAFYAAQK